MSLDPVSVEITYGVERIMMALQGVDRFDQIVYAPGVTFGEIFGQAEYEMSRYYLDDADLDTQWRLFDDYAAEAQRMLDRRLPVPAHLYILKCSHTFNVLDARGAVSTTERARAFARMRGLARVVAQLWAERRAELHHPLGLAESPAAAPTPAEFPAAASGGRLLLEIGTEELPAAEVTHAARAVRESLGEKLAGTRLGHGDITTYATPRRTAVLVEDVQAREPDAERIIRGPRTAVAFDADGNPTAAAIGFARAQGLEPHDLGRLRVADTEYVGVTRVDRGRGAFEVLSTLLADLVGQLRSDKNMRWSAPGLSFSRPIRWLVALLGDTVVPVSVSTLAAGRVTRVHRTADQPTLEVPSAGAYVQLLDRHGVVVDPGRRRQQILDAASELSRSVGGQADHAQREGRLLDEIANLVEQPVPMLGSFAAHYLDLPPEVLTTVMRKHQRYLPVRDVHGGLLPYFVAVADGACDHDRVRAGNEAVVRARFEDASFFWRADLQTSVEDMRRALGSLAFEERLGSMAQRADRIADVAGSLAEYVPLSSEETETLRRAARLAKFDLASRMVVELTDLAGTMAREYARRAGEPESVAQALFDMELPRSAGDDLPATLPGAVLALADRFDLLTGLFAAGAQPTGSSDPFGLRRAAAGVVSILRARPRLHDISIERGVAAAAERVRAHGLEVSEGVPAEVTDFIVRRYEQQLLDSGNDSREVAAILPLALRPRHADDTLAQLARRVRDGDFARLASALQRVRNIVPPDTEPRYETAQLREPAERALVEALAAVRTALGPNFSLDEFVEAARVLIDPINAFFDEILVMTPEREVREARLGLLAEVRNVASLALDWDALGSDLPAVG